MWKVRKSPCGHAAGARGITRTRIGVRGKKTSKRRRIFRRRRGMSQEQLSEGAAVAPAARAGTSDGMFRPGRTQRETLLMVLRMAARHEQWMTLEELAGKTKYPPASISAQLRHLRKVEYGGWVVEKRRREWEKEEVVWEYRLAEGNKEAGQ